MKLKDSALIVADKRIIDPLIVKELIEKIYIHPAIKKSPLYLTYKTKE